MNLASELSQALSCRARLLIRPPQLMPRALFSHGDSTEYFEKKLQKSTNYLEYGSGGSTLFAATHPHLNVLSIEADGVFAKLVRRNLVAHAHETATVELVVKNLGLAGRYSMPISAGCSWPSRKRKFQGYILYPFSSPSRYPYLATDLVLIDGRFRVACALAALQHCPRAEILIDDYLERPFYHVLEKMGLIDDVVGNMAIIRPKPSAKRMDWTSYITLYAADPR